MRPVSLAVLLLASLPALAQAQGLRPSTRLGDSRAPTIAATAPNSGAATQRSADYIVAVVNSEPITNNEVNARVVRLEQQLSREGAALPGRDELARQVLERLINERAQIQHARETGIKVDDAAVDQAEINVARQNQLDVPQLRQRLVREDISVAQFREDLRNQLTLSRLRERDLEPQVKVSEADIDQFIRKQLQEVDPAAVEVNIAQILVAVPEDAPPSQVTVLQARAERLAGRARAGEDFGKLAAESSDAPNAAQTRGEFGLRSLDRYPELFVQTLEGLSPGAVAGPVRSGAGFHILKLVEKRQGKLPSMQVTQHRARHILLRPGPSLTESQAREQLNALRRQIASGQADFAALARAHSQDGSAREGGDLGWANPGQFVPEFEEVLNQLAPGQVSEPVVSRFGMHLIQLLERRQAALSEREQREMARGVVREQKLEEAYADWARDIRGRAWVELREAPQ